LSLIPFKDAFAAAGHFISSLFLFQRLMTPTFLTTPEELTISYPNQIAKSNWFSSAILGKKCIEG
jgi:hypothetical protein